MDGIFIFILGVAVGVAISYIVCIYVIIKLYNNDETSNNDESSAKVRYRMSEHFTCISCEATSDIIPTTITNSEFFKDIN